MSRNQPTLLIIKSLYEELCTGSTPKESASKPHLNMLASITRSIINCWMDNGTTYCPKPSVEMAQSVRDRNPCAYVFHVLQWIEVNYNQEVVSFFNTLTTNNLSRNIELLGKIGITENDILILTDLASKGQDEELKRSVGVIGDHLKKFSQSNEIDNNGVRNMWSLLTVMSVVMAYKQGRKRGMMNIIPLEGENQRGKKSKQSSLHQQFRQPQQPQQIYRSHDNDTVKMHRFIGMTINTPTEL